MNRQKDFAGTPMDFLMEIYATIENSDLPESQRLAYLNGFINGIDTTVSTILNHKFEDWTDAIKSFTAVCHLYEGIIDKIKSNNPSLS